MVGAVRERGGKEGRKKGKKGRGDRGPMIPTRCGN